MFEIGLIDQIMRYLMVVVLWQLSQESLCVLCWSYGFWFV